MDAFTISYSIILEKSKGIYYTFMQSFFVQLAFIFFVHIAMNFSEGLSIGLVLEFELLIYY